MWLVRRGGVLMPIVLPPAAAMLPFTSPTLAEALTRLRQDIFDQAGPCPRWQDSDLARALDRAIDRYSAVVPWTQTILIPALGGSRLYAVPAAAGPSWWVESVEFPAGCYPGRTVPFRELAQPSLGTPPAPVAALNGTLPGPLNGSYRYVVTYQGIAGETAIGAPSILLTAAHQQALLSLPLGPRPYCRSRVIYRTTGSGMPPYLWLSRIADNTTAAFVDAMSDDGLGGPAPAADGTANVPLVELQIPDSLLPDPADPGTLAVTVAGKQVLAENGTTVPPQDHELVLLGAAAYACLAFQVPTNDLFEYQDGEMRDRVSEVKTPEHWQATGRAFLERFEGRLEEVKRQHAAGAATVAQWGGVARRWQWV